MVNLAISYETVKKIILIFLVFMVLNYSFNSIFDYTYLLPLTLAIVTERYIFMQVFFPQKFELFKEDVLMICIVLYSLLHSLFFETLDYTLLVVGMSFVPYFFSRFITLTDEDIEFMIKLFCVLGVVLLGFYYKSAGFGAVSGRFRIGGRHPVGIAADFGLVAVSLSYILFTSKKYWVKIVCSFLLLATFYMIVFILATRGASFSAIIAVTYLYFMLSTTTLRDKIKRIFWIGIFITIFITLITNDAFIEKYPKVQRFTIQGIMEDPSVTGNDKFTGRRGFALKSIKIISRSAVFGEGMGAVYSHNIFLEWLASLGIIGLLPFLIFLSTIFKKAFKVRKLNPKFTIFFTMMIYTFVLRLISFSMISHKSFFVICGLMLSYYYTYDNS